LKALRIPLFVLILLLAICLCSTARMEIICHRWAQELENTQKAVEDYDFDKADKALQELEADWNAWQTYLHIAVEHSEIDQAQELLDLCRLQVDEMDTPAFLIAANRLQGQLDLLREMEQLSIKNVL